MQSYLNLSYKNNETEFINFINSLFVKSVLFFFKITNNLSLARLLLDLNNRSRALFLFMKFKFKLKNLII